MPHPIEKFKNWRVREYGMGIGQGGVIKQLRGQYGQAYNIASQNYNARASSILNDAKAALDSEGFSGSVMDFLETDKGRSFKEDLIRTKNDVVTNKIKLEDGTEVTLEDLDRKLNNALDDYEAINGRPFRSRRNNEVFGELMGGKMKTAAELETTTEGFSTSVTGGPTYEYSRTNGRNVVRSRSVNGVDREISRESVDPTFTRRLVAKDVNGNPVYSQPQTISKEDYVKARRAAMDGKKAGTGTYERLLYDSEGKVVPTGTNGATTVFKNSKGFADNVVADVSDLNTSPATMRRAYRNAYNNSAEEAARIAKTGVGDHSGIFKQITSAAKANPVVAAAVVLGGYGLINKALDRRREYS